MTDNSPKLSTYKPVEMSLARQRLIWVLKPLGLLALVLWVLYPTTADQLDHTHTALVGFLLGALYGLVVYTPAFKQYVLLSQPSGRLQANRVPEEYYWGRVENIMFDNENN